MERKGMTPSGFFIRGSEVWFDTMVVVSDGHGNESEHDVEVMLCDVSEIPTAIHDLTMLACSAKKSASPTWKEGEQKT